MTQEAVEAIEKAKAKIAHVVRAGRLPNYLGRELAEALKLLEQVLKEEAK
jgi:hypothetical protein